MGLPMTKSLWRNGRQNLQARMSSWTCTVNGDHIARICMGIGNHSWPRTLTQRILSLRVQDVKMKAAPTRKDVRSVITTKHHPFRTSCMALRTTCRNILDPATMQVCSPSQRQTLGNPAVSLVLTLGRVQMDRVTSLQWKWECEQFHSGDRGDVQKVCS